ncbi:MAG TPA: sugar nucleotide-binding protein, partial [Chitinophagales bacterium]|nr:sugar nucleotide-binding protein [Chitinophagales bacterium]
MSKILVTGAHGQVGMELNFLSSLLENHAFVFVGHSDLDIADEAAVQAFLSKDTYSAVINCAAYTAVDKAESEKEQAFAINGAGAGNLAKACKQGSAKFIHFSTDFIFDGTHSVPYTEDEG